MSHAYPGRRGHSWSRTERTTSSTGPREGPTRKRIPPILSPCTGRASSRRSGPPRRKTPPARRGRLPVPGGMPSANSSVFFGREVGHDPVEGIRPDRAVRNGGKEEEVRILLTGGAGFIGSDR